MPCARKEPGLRCPGIPGRTQSRPRFSARAGAGRGGVERPHLHDQHPDARSAAGSRSPAVAAAPPRRGVPLRPLPIKSLAPSGRPPYEAAPCGCNAPRTPVQHGLPGGVVAPVVTSPGVSPAQARGRSGPGLPDGQTCLADRAGPTGPRPPRAVGGRRLGSSRAECGLGLGAGHGGIGCRAHGERPRGGPDRWAGGADRYSWQVPVGSMAWLTR